MHVPVFAFSGSRFLTSRGIWLTTTPSNRLAFVLGLILFATPAPAADSESTPQSIPNSRPTPVKSSQLSSDNIKALRAFGDKLARDISNGNTNQVDQVMDVPAVWDSVSRNLQASEATLNRAKLGFIAGMRHSPGGLFRNLLGKDVKFLRVRTRDGEAVILLRVRMGDSDGASYLDVFTTRDPAGSFRVRDFFNMALGENMSTLSSRLIAKALAAESKSPLEAMFGGNRAKAKEFASSLALSELLGKGQFLEVLNQSDALAPAARKDRFVQFVRVQAASALKDEARQLQVLDEMAATFPGDPTFAFILLDRHFIKKEFTKALETVKLLMGDLGRDAFLSALEASCLSELHRPKDALNAVEEGLKLENGDRQLLWTKVSLLAREKHYTETIDVLEEILKRHNQFANPAKAQEAGLTEFFASPEGVAYVERLKRLGHLNSNRN